MAIARVNQRAEVAKTRPSPAGDRDRYARAAQILLIIVTVAVLWPVCTNDFTTWDDDKNVSQNPRLNPVTFDGVLYFWRHPFMSEYIPLSYTVWAGLASIAGVTPDAAGISLNPYVFHLANLLLHIAAVIVAFQLLRLLTGCVWAAAMGALFFAVHPIQVEAVAWVTGLKDVLCGALSLVALWQYVLFAKSTDTGAPAKSDRARTIHYAAATSAFILAMLSKPSAVTVPLAALLIDRFCLSRSWKQIATALAPWMILALACGVLARVVHKLLASTDGGPLWSRPLLAGAALAFYLYKLVWPIRFAVLYHYSVPDLLEGHWLWFAWIVPATVAIVVGLYRKRWPWLLCCTGLVLVSTLPVLGLTPFQFEGHSLVADRYFYFAMIGPALAVAYALASAPHPKIPASVCALCLAVLGIRAYFQTAHWHDTDTLFTHELTVNPASAVAYNSLSDCALARRELPLAEHLSRESIRVTPKQIDAYVTLGIVLMSEGRTQEVAPLWLFAYEHNPDDPAVLTNLAGLLAGQSDNDPRKLAEAERLCRHALEIDPLMASARENLAIILSHQGHFAEALRESQTSVELHSTDPDSQITLAFLLEHEHQHEAAIHHLTEALALDPNNVRARQLLASLSRTSH